MSSNENPKKNNSNEKKNTNVNTKNNQPKKVNKGNNSNQNNNNNNIKKNNVNNANKNVVKDVKDTNVKVVNNPNPNPTPKKKKKKKQNNTPNVSEVKVLENKKEEVVIKKADNRFIEEEKENIKKEIKEEIKEEAIKEVKINKRNKRINIILVILFLIIILLIALAFGFLVYLSNLKPFKDATLELGNANIALKDFVKDSDILEDCELITDLSKINFKEVGTHKVQISYKNVINTVNLTIKDTIPPTLELQDKEVYVGEEAKKEDFIKEVLDISGDVETTLDTKIDTSIEGEQKISITAKDINGNKITKEATLKIITDKTAPKITGLTNLTVKKNAKINYTSGVKATDDRDGKVEFTYDASKVDTSKTGSYYVTYTATDKSGNKATAKRKITVDHDDEDTKALVQKIAATLSSDPEELRDYCRNTIKYDHYDGGDDALYYGLTNKKGNCYVHAQCFKALLDTKGIENQLIWVTNKTHYWNLVKINGVWRHMDSTPDRNHRKISIMTDEQRLSTLSGRKWDFSAWPTAN